MDLPNLGITKSWHFAGQNSSIFHTGTVDIQVIAWVVSTAKGNLRASRKNL